MNVGVRMVIRIFAFRFTQTDNVILKNKKVQKDLLSIISDSESTEARVRNRNIEDITTLILKNVGNKKIIINGLEFGIKNLSDG